MSNLNDILALPEEEMIERMVEELYKEQGNRGAFFRDSEEILLRRSLTVLKRLEDDVSGQSILKGQKVTFHDLYSLILNVDNRGQKLIEEFSKIRYSDRFLLKENEDITSWFISDYFTGSLIGSRGPTKTYQHCYGLQRIVKSWLKEEQK